MEAAGLGHHPPGGEGPGAWLRHGVMLLRTIEPGAEAGQQQQQAALAFLQAVKEGASDADVQAAQLDAVIGNLRTAIAAAGLSGPPED
ncbi:hypothetical protein [Synechococcus sp. CCY 9618]|uniref:hypothetical protein n=1 Tax=Synechococcus sp. CCY 9618 TaxID=2815602 RepID=UPI001C24ABEA|nr:hypothetical protein [Synechococcus sp. CCY 9618]